MATRKKKSTKRSNPGGDRSRKQVSAARKTQPVDEHAATELVLYIENASELSPDGPRGQGHSVLLNALRKWRKGTYDPKLAVRLFEYLVESGAKQYAKEFGSDQPWNEMFNPATRRAAAEQLEASFRNSAEHGEYDRVDTRIERSRETREDRHSLTGPGTDGLYRYRGASIELSGFGRNWHATVRFRSQEKDFDGRSSNEALEKAKDWIDAAPEFKGRHTAPPDDYGRPYPREPRSAHRAPTRKAREDRSERKFSMTYGTLPPYSKFERDVHTRIDPEDDEPYWPAGTIYPMELVSSEEIDLAEQFGGLDEFRAERHRTGRNTSVRGFRGDERAIYGFLEFLVEEFNDGNEAAGDLASSIMYTLGYEWI